jgi:hypothetical protein
MSRGLSDGVGWAHPATAQGGLDRSNRPKRPEIRVFSVNPGGLTPEEPPSRRILKIFLENVRHWPFT